jgi:dTDP-4-dehydrorhamnose reductase
MMRVLLTGTSGQVGGALAPLLRKNCEVLSPQRAQFDLANPAMLTGALDRLKPDLIINPAAYTAVDRAEDEADLAFRVNAEGPACMARWSARHQVPIIHFSTDYVFDGTGTTPWREDSLTGPLSVYGASKRAGEKAIEESGCPSLIMRTSWVYAAKGTNFLRTITRLSLERKELRIVADQIGSPTSARAIADALDMLLQRRSELDLAQLFTKSGGFVHIACAGETSWHGFGTAIVAGLKARGVELQTMSVVPIQTSEFPTKATRPANSRMDLTRLFEVFFVAMPSWQRALDCELDQLSNELRRS